jgi:hypothetical protein
LATSTGTELGGWAEVVVVVGVAWCVVDGVVDADPVADVVVDPVADVVADGWITRSRSTVARTNITSTIAARPIGNAPPCPPECAEGCSSNSEGSSTGCQPANLGG